MRPFAIDGVLSPPPSAVVFQASGGPPFGHSLSRPVSLEWAVRSGPCHCGQSSADAEDISRAEVRMPMTGVANRIGRLMFMRCLGELESSLVVIADKDI